MRSNNTLYELLNANKITEIEQLLNSDPKPIIPDSFLHSLVMKFSNDRDRNQKIYQIIDLLVEKHKFDINTRDTAGQTVFEIACLHYGQFETEIQHSILDFLVNKGVSKNIILYAACETISDRVMSVERDEYYFNLIERCLRLSDANQDAGIDILADGYRPTPINLIINNTDLRHLGRFQVLERFKVIFLQLLENYSDKNKWPLYGLNYNTLLILSIVFGWTDVAQNLIKLYKEEMAKVDFFAQNPIEVAFRTGSQVSLNIAKLLIENDCYKLADYSDSLWCLLRRNRFDLVDLLKEHGYPTFDILVIKKLLITSKDNSETEIKFKSNLITKILISGIVLEDFNRVFLTNLSVDNCRIRLYDFIYLYANGNNEELRKIFKVAKLEISEEDLLQSESFLIEAVRNNDLNLVMKIIEFRKTKEPIENLGEIFCYHNALFEALKIQNHAIAEYLIENSFSLHLMVEDKMQDLKFLHEMRKDQIAKLIMEKKFPVHMIFEIYCNAHKKKLTNLKQLILENTELTLVDSKKNTLLHLMIKLQDLEGLKALLQLPDADKIINFHNEGDSSAFTMVIEDIVELTNLSSNSSGTHQDPVALLDFFSKAAWLLYQKECDLTLTSGENFLLMALQNKLFDFARNVINNGYNVDMSSNGITPLEQAIIPNAPQDLIELIYKKTGKDLFFVTKFVDHLIEAKKIDYLIKAIIDCGVSKTDSDGNTLLHLFCQKMRTLSYIEIKEILKEVFKGGVPPEVRNNQNKTPFECILPDFKDSIRQVNCSYDEAKMQYVMRARKHGLNFNNNIYKDALNGYINARSGNDVNITTHELRAIYNAQDAIAQIESVISNKVPMSELNGITTFSQDVTIPQAVKQSAVYYFLTNLDAKTFLNLMQTCKIYYLLYSQVASDFLKEKMPGSSVLMTKQAEFKDLSENRFAFKIFDAEFAKLIAAVPNIKSELGRYYLAYSEQDIILHWDKQYLQIKDGYSYEIAKLESVINTANRKDNHIAGGMDVIAEVLENSGRDRSLGM